MDLEKMNSWCKLKDIYCSMANTNGYCQLSSCMYITDSMSVCDNALVTYKDRYIPIKGYIPIKLLKAKTIEELCELLEDWEKENDKDSE